MYMFTANAKMGRRQHAANVRCRAAGNAGFA